MKARPNLGQTDWDPGDAEIRVFGKRGYGISFRLRKLLWERVQT